MAWCCDACTSDSVCTCFAVADARAAVSSRCAVDKAACSSAVLAFAVAKSAVTAARFSCGSGTSTVSLGRHPPGIHKARRKIGWTSAGRCALATDLQTQAGAVICCQQLLHGGLCASVGRALQLLTSRSQICSLRSLLLHAMPGMILALQRS
jgi:hypothetical protein